MYALNVVLIDLLLITEPTIMRSSSYFNKAHFLEFRSKLYLYTSGFPNISRNNSSVNTIVQTFKQLLKAPGFLEDIQRRRGITFYLDDFHETCLNLGIKTGEPEIRV